MLKLIILSVFSLFFGLISCKSDSKNHPSPPKVLFTQDDFRIKSLEIYKENNNSYISTSSKDLSVNMFSLNDSFHIDLTGVSKLKVDSTCQQDNVEQKATFYLELKPSYFIYEWISPKLVKSFISKNIICNWQVVATNERSSSHSITLEPLEVEPSTWRPRLKIFDLKSQSILRAGSYLHTPDIENLTFNYQLPYDEVELTCGKGQTSIKANNQFDLYSLILKKLFRKTAKTSSWASKNCRLLTYKNLRVAEWSPNFNIFNTKKITDPTPFKSTDDFPLTFDIKNLSKHDLYIRINKDNLYSNIKSISGFNKLKSQILQSRTKISSPSWHSSDKITQLKLYSKNATAIKSHPTEYIFKLKKLSTATFFLKDLRKKHCKKVFIDTTEITMNENFEIDILFNLTASAKVKPYETIVYEKLPPQMYQKTYTKNPSLYDIMVGKNPDFRSKFRSASILRSSVIANIRKNYSSEFNCKQAYTIPRY